MRQSLKKLNFKAKVFLFTKIYVSRIKPDCVKHASWYASGNSGDMLNLAKRKGMKRRQGGGTWIILERSMTTIHELLGYSSNSIVSLNGSLPPELGISTQTEMLSQNPAIGPCMNINVWQTLSPHVE